MKSRNWVVIFIRSSQCSMVKRAHVGASNKVVAGGAKELPYSESFDTESSLDLFTILSANGDNSTWKYESSKKMVQYWGGSDATMNGLLRLN